MCTEAHLCYTGHKVSAVASKKLYFPALDGVRGVALACVLAHNLGYFEGATALGTVSDRLVGAGWVGVQLFFVLSGFLITGILIDSKGARNFLGSFFMRRILRIFPLYYLALFGYFVLIPYVRQVPQVSDSGTQLWYWLYLSNWSSLVGRGVAPLGHLWSLAVEEQFYLLWPFAVLALRARGFVRLCVALIVAAFAARVCVRMAGLPPAWAYQATVSRIDALALGALGAVVVRRRWLTPASVRRLAFFAFAVLGVVFIATGGLPRTSLAVQTIGYSVVALASLALVLLGSSELDRPWTRKVKLVLEWYPLQQLGKYSYAIYVAHQLINAPLHWRVEHLLEGASGGVRFAVAFAYMVIVSVVSYGVAFVSWHLFERHFLSLKRFFVPRVDELATR